MTNIGKYVLFVSLFLMFKGYLEQWQKIIIF